MAREVAIVALLYALWQYVFALTVTRTAGALDHARSIFDFEQLIGLPSELTVQQWSMRSDVMIEFLNQYYAYVHVVAMGVLIVWLFFRHRERYPRVRNILALSTGACLALQSIPVAPPRFLPDLGFVDTGLLYGQSVYGAGGSGLSNQLAAMPSVHIAWSSLIAGAVIWASRSQWRWLVLVHPVITLWAVVATGNHWWADAIVAWVLLAMSIAVLEVLAMAQRPRLDNRSGDQRAAPSRHRHPRT
ncbi:MAG TPA: phosphatase PAP2 family protein [Acidimicrobiales bacterium]|nr:phosphatase PAP2 family protein [Acidimicrobiales bacterium]